MRKQIPKLTAKFCKKTRQAPSPQTVTAKSLDAYRSGGGIDHGNILYCYQEGRWSVDCYSLAVDHCKQATHSLPSQRAQLLCCDSQHKQPGFGATCCSWSRADPYVGEQSMQHVLHVGGLYASFRPCARLASSQLRQPRPKTRPVMSR